MSEWEFELIDALILGDLKRAESIAYQNEGEQIKMF